MKTEQKETTPAPVSKKMHWAGRFTSTLSIVFHIFDSVITFVDLTPIVESFHWLGYSEGLATGMGILEIVIGVV